EAVARLQNADVGNAAGVAFAADAAGDHASAVGAQSHDHEIIEKTVVRAGLGHAEPSLKARGVRGRHDGLRHVQPFVGAAGALLYLTHGRQVFVELAAILVPDLVLHALRVIGHQIENASAPAQAAADGLLAVLFNPEEHVENLVRASLCGNLDSVLGPGQRLALDGHF